MYGSYMDNKQSEMWDLLCTLSGEDVARLFTDCYGLQLLGDEFYEHLVDEGYIYPEEEEEEEEEDEEEE